MNDRLFHLHKIFLQSQGLSRLLRDDQFVDVTLVVNNTSSHSDDDSDLNEFNIEGILFVLNENRIE